MIGQLHHAVFRSELSGNAALDACVQPQPPSSSRWGPPCCSRVLADQVNWGGTLYKSMLIIPYAVAPPLAGVLWLFLFNPSGGVLTELLHHFGYTWNHKINGNQALFLLIVSASWKQISYNFLFFLAGCTPSPARSSRPRPSTARPRGGGSARSFSRFCRPQASSCLW